MSSIPKYKPRGFRGQSYMTDLPNYNAIIEYAKERHAMQDFFERGNLTDEEKELLRDLLTILSDIKAFVPKVRREHRKEIAKNVETLLNAQAQADILYWSKEESSHSAKSVNH